MSFFWSGQFPSNYKVTCRRLASCLILIGWGGPTGEQSVSKETQTFAFGDWVAEEARLEEHPPPELERPSLLNKHTSAGQCGHQGYSSLDKVAASLEWFPQEAPLGMTGGRLRASGM